jgi:hypothetical protein
MKTVYDLVDDILEGLTEARETLLSIENITFKLEDYDYSEEFRLELSDFICDLLCDSQDSEVILANGELIHLNDNEFSKGFRAALLSVAQELVNKFDLESLDVADIDSINEFIANV